MTDIGELNRKLDRLLGAEGLGEEGKDGPYIFNDDEVKTLQRLIAFTRKVEALGWWGKIAFYLVGAVGAIIINWERIRSWVVGI